MYDKGNTEALLREIVHFRLLIHQKEQRWRSGTGGSHSTSQSMAQ